VLPFKRGVPDRLRGKEKMTKMRYEQFKQTTQRLRHEATPEEKKLWKYLRRKQLNGRKFLRQHTIIYESIGDEHFSYVPDFYCFKENLPIELDGKIHEFHKKRYERRDEIVKTWE
jgi:very-short-patch-repair endonuclease